MKTLFIVPLLFSLLIISCRSKNEPSGPTEKQSIDSFFPVTSFIKGQIRLLDSLPVTPLHIRTIHGKSDTAWLTWEKLKPLLQPFLEPVISETNLSRHFKETTFHDQTLNAITFTYDPIQKLPQSISLRHWDIYIDPEKSNVTKVYIVKQESDNDRVLTHQLTWQANSSAKIVTLLNKPGGEMELLKEEFYTWDF